MARCCCHGAHVHTTSLCAHCLRPPPILQRISPLAKTIQGQDKYTQLSKLRYGALSADQEKVCRQRSSDKIHPKIPLPEPKGHQVRRWWGISSLSAPLGSKSSTLCPAVLQRPPIRQCERLWPFGFPTCVPASFSARLFKGYKKSSHQRALFAALHSA